MGSICPVLTNSWTSIIRLLSGAVCFELRRIDDDIFPVLHFKPFDLLFRRHGLLFIGTDHLLPQFDMITPVKEVKLDPLFLDRGMQLHGHFVSPKWIYPFQIVLPAIEDPPQFV